MSTVGDNIARIRKQKGWTQEELAIKMGYKSKSTINKIELGINDIPQSKIAKFAEVLGTTPTQLMGWCEILDIDLQLLNNSPPTEPQLSEGEKLLLNLFRQVPEESQQLVLQMIRVALGNPQ